MGSGTSKTKRPRLRIRKPLSDQDWRDWANEMHSGHMRATDMQNHRGQWITLRANTQAGVLEYFEGGEWRGLGYGAGGGGTAFGGARAGAGGGVDIPNHNLLPGLQGGAPWRGEYYHFQRAAHDELARFWDGGLSDLSGLYMADGHVDTLHVRQRIGIGAGAEASPGYPLHVQESVPYGGGPLGLFKNPSAEAGAAAIVAVENDVAGHGAALAAWSTTAAGAPVPGFVDHGGVYSAEASAGLVVLSLSGPVEFWLYQGAYPAGSYTHVADVTNDGACNGVIPTQDGQYVLGSEAAGLRWAAGSFDTLYASAISAFSTTITVSGRIVISASAEQLILEEDNGQRLSIWDTSTGTQCHWDLSPVNVNSTDDVRLRFFRTTNTSGGVYAQFFKGDGTSTATATLDASTGSLALSGDATVGGIAYADQLSPVGNTLGLLTAPNASYGLYYFDYCYPDGTPNIGFYAYTYVNRQTSASTAGSTYSAFIRQMNRGDSGYDCTGWLLGLHIQQLFHATDVTGAYSKAATLYLTPVSSVGLASLTDSYALYINAPAGATNNYAIYAAGGDVRFGGALTVTYSQPNVSITGTSTGTNAYAIISLGSEAGTDTTAGVRFHNDATGWHCGVHTDDSFAISHSYGGTMSSIVMSITGYATSAVVNVDGQIKFGATGTAMQQRTIGWGAVSGGVFVCGYGGVDFGGYRYAASAYAHIVRILGPWNAGVQARMWPAYDNEVDLGASGYRWKSIWAALKSGTTQAGAGAAAGEMWVDTDDGYTIKMGV